MDEPKQEPQLTSESTQPSVEEVESMPATPEITEQSAQDPFSTPKQPSFTERPAEVISAPVADASPQTSSEPATAKRFFAAYITSLLSAVVLLSSGAWLGYVLLGEWLSPKKTEASLFSFDLAPLYISLMSSMIVFGVLYFVAYQYVARCVSRETVDRHDWRNYHVVYGLFSGSLLVTAAGILASFLYIPIAQLTLADEFKGYEVAVQLLGGLHVLLWIGLLLWQEKLAKGRSRSWLPAVIVVVLAVVLVVLTAIFPIGTKTDQRYDAKISSDLSLVQAAVSSYKASHTGQLPAKLSDVTFDDPTTSVKDRLQNYTYTVKKTDSFGNNSELMKVQTQVGQSGGSDPYMDYYPISTPLASYQLCATFRTDTSTNSTDSSVQSLFGGASGYSDGVSFTQHKSGNVCFDRS